MVVVVVVVVVIVVVVEEVVVVGGDLDKNPVNNAYLKMSYTCLLYTSPSPRDRTRSRMPSSA